MNIATDLNDFDPSAFHDDPHADGDPNEHDAIAEALRLSLDEAKARTLFLVDMGAIYWHAWHSSNRDMAPDEPAEAAIGRVRRWAEEYPQLAVCCDDPSGTWRHKAYAEYKATRTEKPAGASAQLARAIDVLRRDGFPVWMHPNMEADDVLASAATIAVSRGIDVVLATPDKDLAQLVCDRVSILNPRTGKLLRAPDVVAKYGVRPDQIGDWLALVGDASDNIPGAKGIGDKTAAELLAAHGTLPEVMKASRDPESEMTPKRRALLADSKDNIHLSRELVTLVVDLPIPIDEALGTTEPAPEPISDTIPETTATTATTGANTMTQAMPINRPKFANAAPTQAKPAGPSRMTLEAIMGGYQESPHRTVIYGVEGIGKTTFAASAPKPIILGAEDGLGFLSAKRFPTPDTWAEVHQALDTLTDREHPYKTFIVDTLDWLEPLVWSAVCSEGGKKSIKDFGFGDGYTAALEKSREFMKRLKTLRDKRGMNIVLISHAHLKKLANPEGEDYERYTMKLHEKTGAAFREWADDVLFANWETYTAADSSGKHKGIGTGKRLLFTEKRPGFEAKNRWSLPETIEMPSDANAWRVYTDAVNHNRKAGEHILAALKDQPERLTKAREWLDTDPPIHQIVAKRNALLENTQPANEGNNSNEGETK